MIKSLTKIYLVYKSAEIQSALFVLQIIIIIGGIEMAKKLTAGILQGASYTEVMEVEWQGEKFEIEIKALTNKQSSEIEALMQEGVDMKGKPGMKGKMERVMDFDLKKNAMGRYESNLKTVALGTTDESLTEKVIENEFPPKLVKEISARIRQITGIGNKDEIEGFNEGGENPSDSDRE